MRRPGRPPAKQHRRSRCGRRRDGAELCTAACQLGQHTAAAAAAAAAAVTAAAPCYAPTQASKLASQAGRAPAVCLLPLALYRHTARPVARIRALIGFDRKVVSVSTPAGKGKVADRRRCNAGPLRGAGAAPCGIAPVLGGAARLLPPHPAPPHPPCAPGISIQSPPSPLPACPAGTATSASKYRASLDCCSHTGDGSRGVQCGRGNTVGEACGGGPTVAQASARQHHLH